MNKYNYQENLDHLKTFRGYTLHTGFTRNDFIALQELIDNYHTLKNELCLYCGKYKNEHLGACKDCRWHDGK